MSDLPGSWTTASFGETGLASPPSLDPARFPDEAFDLYSVPAFAVGHPEIVTGRTIRSAKQIVEPGDVLVCKIIPHLNRVWVVGPSRDRRQIASGEWIVVRPRWIDPRFLKHLFSSPSFREEFLGTVSGVGGSLLRARPQAVATIEVPIAPLAEQRRIVTRIEALRVRSGRARDALAAVPTLIERCRRALLTAAFRGDLTADWREDHPDVEPASAFRQRILMERRRRWEEAERERRRRRGRDVRDGPWLDRYTMPAAIERDPLPELPDRWERVALDELAWNLQYGSSAKASSDAAGVPVLRMGNIVGGRLDLTDLKYLPANHREFPDLLLADGDVLFNRTNSHELVGKAAAYAGEPSPCSFASYLIRIRLAGYDPHLLAAYINSYFGRAWVWDAVSQQVGQANVNGSKLRALAVPLAPKAELTEIARRLELAEKRLRALMPIVREAVEQTGRLDRVVLAKAFRGELVSQDPNDEPAAELLERISAEREAQPASQRRRRRVAPG